MIVSPVRNEEFRNYLDLILKILLIGTLLVPLIVTESTFFPYITGKAFFARTLIQISFLIWLIRIVTAEKILLKFDWVISFAIGLTALSILTSWFGISFNNSLWSTYERMQGLIEMAHWSAFLLMLVSTFRTSEFLSLLLPANFIIVTLVALIGSLQYHGVFLSLNFLEYTGQDSRIDSTVGNPTYLGAICGINIFVGLILAAGKFNGEISSSTLTRAVRRRVSQTTSTFEKSTSFLPYALIATACFVNLYALFLSGTRASILAILISALVTSLLFGFYKTNFQTGRKLIVAAVFAISILLTAFFGYKESNFVSSFTNLHPTLERFSNLSLSESSVSGRYETWKTGLTAYAEKPLVGWGVDNFMTSWAKHYDGEDPNDERFDQAHNKAIEVLVTTGIVGFMAYLGLWISIVCYSLKIYRQRLTDQTWSIFLLGALFVYFLQSLALFDTQPIQAQFMVLLSCLVISVRGPKYINSSDSRSISFSSYFNPKIHTIAKCGICVGLIPIIIYLLNLVAFQPYKAAQTIKLAQNESYDWNKRVTLYEQSMEVAPGLATYPYIYMVDSLVKNETTIDSSDLQNLKKLIDTWSTNILDKDPENWRVLFSTARFYQYYFLKTNDTGAIGKAADAVEILKLSAPAVPETANIIRAQELIESGS